MENNLHSKHRGGSQNVNDFESEENLANEANSAKSYNKPQANGIGSRSSKLNRDSNAANNNASNNSSSSSGGGSSGRRGGAKSNNSTANTHHNSFANNKDEVISRFVCCPFHSLWSILSFSVDL